MNPWQCDPKVKLTVSATGSHDAPSVAAPPEERDREARCAESSGWASGARTVDDYGDMGTILYVEDDHNVHVALDGGGRAIYCCHVGCAEYFPCRLVSSPNDQGEAQPPAQNL